MLEGEYKTRLTKKLYDRFPDCFVVRLDSALRQGIPDMGALFPDGFWALLEAKISMKAKRQPNQGFYIEMFDRMCFARFICPENEEAVLDELQREYENHRKARLPQPQ